MLINLIIASLEKFPYWSDWQFWNVVVLSFTLFFLIRYTRATERSVANQMLPNVEVNLIFDENKSTYFWFSNSSNIPAYVVIEPVLNKERLAVRGPYRLAPSNQHYYHFIRTASFNFLERKLKDGDEIILKTTVRPALEDSRIKLRLTKSYKFNDHDLRLDESSWGYPDPPFPRK